MRTKLLKIAATGLLALATAASASTGDKAVREMIEAHGGWEKWASSPAVQFRHTLSVPGDPDVWESFETIEQGQRRAYLDWPRDEAFIAFDGEKTWSTNWKRLNPPSFMVHVAYYFLNLPWLTQDDGVRLSDAGTGKLPGDDRQYVTVKMTFEEGVGNTPDDYYTIYIDPETHRMKGAEFVVTHAVMLDLFNVPPEVKALGPLYHVYEEYGTFNGLVIPTAYTTYRPDGKPYGNHTVEDIRFDVRFDVSKLAMPDNAVIDTSDPKNRASAK